MEVLRLVNMITGEDMFNNYAKHLHELNAKWWHTKDGVRLNRDPYELLMLATSEVAEAMEGFRKDLQDDHLPQYPMLWVEMADFCIRILDNAGAFNWDIKYGKIDYLPIRDRSNFAARLLQLQDFCVRIAWNSDESDPRSWLRGELVWHAINSAQAIALENGCLDFWEVVYEKLVYNQSREDHSYEAREKKGGKKF